MLISSVSTQNQNDSEVYCFWKETLGQKHFSHLHMCQLGKSLLLKALNSFCFFLWQTDVESNISDISFHCSSAAQHMGLCTERGYDTD